MSEPSPMRLFLIVLTKKAQEAQDKLQKNFEEMLPRPGKIYLCKKGKYIALPLQDGEGGALLLRQDDEGSNYFVCTDFYQYKFISVQENSFRHELPGDVECQIVEDWQIKNCNYLNDAIDCTEIVREVRNKQEWRPAGSHTAVVWETYLKLYEKMIQKSRFGIPAETVQFSWQSLSITFVFDFSGMDDDVDKEDLQARIKKAQGESVRFSLSSDLQEEKEKKYNKGILGDVCLLNGKKITIKLNESFLDNLKRQVESGKFYPEKPREENEKDKHAINTGVQAPDAENPVSMESGTVSSSADKRTFFYDRDRKMPAFSACAEKVDDVWRFAHDSIEPRRLLLFVDYIGDLHQIHRMDEGLRDVKSRDIWEVLSMKRVSRLPEKLSGHVLSKRLDDGQQRAVRGALGAQELFLIWGPPGTGKTEVIAEIARQEAMRGNKTLITSQANLAVDNALSRLANSPDVWHFRVTKENYPLEEDDKGKVPTMDTAGDFFSRRLQKRLVDELKRDSNDEFATTLRKQLLQRLKKGKPTRLPEHAMPQMAELWRRRINVVGATLMETSKMVGNKEERQRKIYRTVGIKEFETVIVDEVSKATPPELFLPMSLGKRIILVGDHKQLPPMYEKSNGEMSLEEWADEAGVPKNGLGLDKTLFERLWDWHDKESAHARAMLTRQYRMSPDLQKLIEPFYEDEEGRLECGLKSGEMPPISDEGFFADNAIWIDTTNDAWEEKEGTSSYNQDEIRIVGKLLNALAGLPQSKRKDLSVGVITFYGAQLRKLREKFEKYNERFGGLLFGTVDRFQGRECDVVICSLVRKNKKQNIGFAAKPNRINVAFSRARRLLCIVGNRGQFCYEANNKARDIYKQVYELCSKKKENNIPEDSNAELDMLAEKWGANGR